MAANWVINELFGRLKKEGHDITESPVSAAQLGGIIDLIAAGTISGKMAKDLFEIVYTEGGDPAAGREARHEAGHRHRRHRKALDEIIAANPEQVEKAKANPKLAGWFTGQVIKATGGKANPAAVNALVAGPGGLWRMGRGRNEKPLRDLPHRKSSPMYLGAKPGETRCNDLNTKSFPPPSGAKRPVA
jgi:aspartyl-tRNA(Asn)/glutamyl-tRNA(Gln) amidotransferase subunit B